MSAGNRSSRQPGIEERHSTRCAGRSGARCNCKPRYRGYVREPVTRKEIKSAWTTSRAQAVAWRQEAVVAVRKGALRPSTPTTVKEAGKALIAGMKSGAILDRTGAPYKPSTIRAYEQALTKYAYPRLGPRKIASLRRPDLQAYVEHLRSLGLRPSTVHNKLDPLRVLVRRAMSNDELLIDPFARLELPLIRNYRTRIEPSAQAEKLIAVLPQGEQAAWALAFFAGLRRGELRALQVDDVDFERGTIHVRRGWDDVEGEIDTKSFAGKRDIPMMGELRRICRAHKLSIGRNGDELFLGRTATDPFIPSTMRSRALKAWKAAQLEPLTTHEARHCAASYFIACGLDWKKVSEFMGHTDVRTTYNRYGKVVPEDLADATEKLDAYFERHRNPAAGQ